GPGVARDHFGGWGPGRPFLGYAADADDARPSEPLAADANAITYGRHAPLDEVEKMLVGIDYDGAGLLRGAEFYDLPATRLGHLLVGGIIFARLLLIVVDPLVGLRIEDLRLRRIGQSRANDDSDGQGHAGPGKSTVARLWKFGSRSGRKDHGCGSA